MGGGPWSSSEDCSCASAVGLGRVSGSTVPKRAAGLRLSSNVPGGWMGSYSSVASVPASLRMTLTPPGWLDMKSVTCVVSSVHNPFSEIR